jgi:hypothetical protein
MDWKALISVIFFVVWIGFAMALKKKTKSSWFMSVAGAFLAATMLMAIPCLFIGNNQSNSSATPSEDLKCKDREAATSNWIKGCRGAGLRMLYGGTFEQADEWCDCINRKIDVRLLMNEHCGLIEPMIPVHFAQEQSAQDACRTPRDPI